MSFTPLRSRLWIAPALLAATACETELTLTPPITRADYVEAQFDPAPAVPALALVPSPTGLGQRPDLKGLTVTALPCERPDVKQCLAFAEGWPTDLPITLFFSGEIDESTVKAGISLYEIQGLVPVKVDYAINVLNPRPPIKEACMRGGNGTTPDRPVSPAEIPPGISLVLTPARPLKPATQYVVMVESDDQGGLRDKAGRRVHPSSLFSLMNAPSDNPPLMQDGTVLNPLLRSNIQGGVLASQFSGKLISDLNDQERATLDAAVKAVAAARIYPLYDFFNRVITPLTTLGMSKREKLVFANAWTTVDPATRIAFNPPASLPFPNTQLMTRSLSSDPAEIHNVQVALPILPPCPNDVPAANCDTRTSSATKGGLNTLRGFSTSGAITIPVTGNLDQASIKTSGPDRNVVLYPYGAGGTVDAMSPHPIVAVAVDSSSTAPALLAIQPIVPLAQNRSYVVGVLKGIKDERGRDLEGSLTYDLLKSPVPIPTLTESSTTVKAQLQCAGVAAKGALYSETEVAGLTMQLENATFNGGAGLNRPRWQPAFAALESLSPAISRRQVLMAFNVRTQDITGTLDLVRRLPGQQVGILDAWDLVRAAAMRPRLSPALQTITGTTAIFQFLGLTQRVCLPICQAGGTSPQIPPAMCGTSAAPNPALDQHPFCGLMKNVFAGNLRTLAFHAMTSFGITTGNPFSGGTFIPQKFTPRDPAMPQLGFQVNPTLNTIGVWVATGSIARGQRAPVTIFQHGFGSSKEAGFFIANSLAAVGQATVMMDLPYHGTRASDVINNTTGVPCQAVDPAMVMCSLDPSNTACTGGCDDVRDPSATGFMSPNIFGTRDNLRQATIDHLTLMRALRIESMMGVVPQLDGATISYVGQSLGGITGGNLVAFAPELTAAVLNVAGGGLVDILLGSVREINGPLYAALAATGNCTLNDPRDPGKGCKDTPAFRQFLGIARWVLDPGDPLANSIGVIGPHGGLMPLGADKVLIQMAVPDLVVRNSTTLALGRAYGFDTMDNGAMSHFQTWNFGAGATDCHGFLLAAGLCGNDRLPLVGGFCATYAAQAQAAGFVASGGARVPPRTVTLPIPGVNCPTF